MSRRYATVALICLGSVLTVSGRSADTEITIELPGQRQVPLTIKANHRVVMRQKAMQLAAKGTYPDFQAALKILERNNEGELSGKDLETWLALHFSRTERSSLKKALKRLDLVEESRRLTDNELFMQAQLFVKTGDPEDWRKAKETFKRLLENSSDKTRVADSYAKQLLQHDEIEDAQPVAELASPITRIRVRARYEAMKGEIERAIEVLVASLPTALDTPQEQGQLLKLAAIAAELVKYDAAFYDFSEEQLVRLAKKVPRESLRLINHRGSHGDIATTKSALQECRKAGDGIASGVRAGVALAILREHSSKWGGPLRDELKQVGEWLGELVRETPDDTSLRSRLAQYYDMVGDLEQAKREYSSILNSNSIDRPIDRGMLLNNLAYAMAHGENHEDALAMIREAKVILGPTGDVIDTEGFLQFACGENELAIKLFRTAIIEDPSVQKQFHLVLALDKAEDPLTLETWRAAVEAGLNKHMVPVPLQDEFLRLAEKYRSKKTQTGD